MSLPEFTIAIWHKPQHDHGYYAEVAASNLEDGLPGGVLQSFEHIGASARFPVLQPDCPFREFRVSRAQALELLEFADGIRYSFAEHAHTPILSGTTFGLRVVRGFQEATLVWYGAYEDQDAAVRELFAAVHRLAQR